MDVRLTSAANSLLLGIWGARWHRSETQCRAGYQWAGPLPPTQDYFIGIAANGQAASYELTVTVTQAEAPPTRIQFAPGATSAT